MDILTKSISILTFEEIEAFCQEEHSEGVQLDYKETFPDKGLKKIISAFANTRGGILIIGVKEDKQTGKPSKWEGVINDGKLEDRVHQFAANVEPLPAYDVHTTNEKNGKVFILVRIFEGDNTPYFVHNDSNLWIRTGNISTPIDIASPKYAELLYLKRERAEEARFLNSQITKTTYDFCLKRGDKERTQLIIDEKAAYQQRRIEEIRDGGKANSFIQKTYDNALGTNVSMLSVLLQPFYPAKALVRPLNLEEIIQNIRTRDRHIESFPVPTDFESIPEGMMYFNWKQSDGDIFTNQFFANGLLYNSHNIRYKHQSETVIYFSYIVGTVHVTLAAAAKFFQKLGYQGTIKGKITLSNVEGLPLIPLVMNFESEKKALLYNNYEWELSLDTLILNNNTQLENFTSELTRDICWDLGLKQQQQHISVEYLKKKELLLLQ